jgi:hypothetical protein
VSQIQPMPWGYGGSLPTLQEFEEKANARALDMEKEIASAAGKCEENIYHAGPVGFEAMWDKILVLEDRFRSGYECEKCEETGKLPCMSCDNGHSRVNTEITCKDCNGTLHIACSDCGGKGVLLEIPQSSQRRPTTGRIVSCGSDVSPQLKRGDSVMYPSFCGEVMDLKGSDEQGREISIVVRMLKDKEIIARVTGHMELRRVSKQQFNVGG